MSIPEWLTKKAEDGDAEAQFKLGKEYRGVKQDDKAIYWWTKAAEQGYAEAQYELGKAYIGDRPGQPFSAYFSFEPQLQDKEKGMYWLTKAAEQNHIDAQGVLGNRYAEGWGTSKNLKKARYWLTKSVNQGNVDAQGVLDYVNQEISSNGGCYVATCVYGSYDCPEVWTFREFRDNTLKNSWLGRLFISIYYATSPKIVELFGENKLFRKACKSILDKILVRLTKEK